MRYLFFIPIFFMLFSMLFILNVYLYDPAQIFHKPYFRKTTFHGDMRIMAKGIIDLYDFDSYILGTSMLENTSANEANQKLGGKWVNISMHGSSFYERKIVLDYIMMRKKVKRIIYTVDNILEAQTPDVRLDTFLYNNTWLDDVLLYTYDKFILCSLSWSQSEKCVGQHRAETIEDSLVKTIYDVQVLYGGVENWLYSFNATKHKERAFELKSLLDSKNLIVEPQASRIQQNISDNVLGVIKQYHETQFYLLIPTYSRLAYKIPYRTSQYDDILLWLVAEIDKLPNAILYGFDDLDYADHIESYRDLTHYNIDMNSMQLDAIRDGTHILTPHNVEKYLNTMRRKIDEYDTKPIIETIESIFKQRGIDLKMQDEQR